MNIAPWAPIVVLELENSTNASSMEYVLKIILRKKFEFEKMRTH
jgi:hypothetical protein